MALFIVTPTPYIFNGIIPSFVIYGYVLNYEVRVILVSHVSRCTFWYLSPAYDGKIKKLQQQKLEKDFERSTNYVSCLPFVTTRVLTHAVRNSDVNHDHVRKC